MKVTHQQPTETQEPAPTQPTPTEPAPTEPAPTETQAPTPTPVPTETQAPTPTPVPPTPKPQVTGYRLYGNAWEDMGKGAQVELTFEGSSESDVTDQYDTYCENHNMMCGGYSVATIYG